MRKVFADTFYWVAIFNERDNYHQQALNVSQALAGAPVDTTDEVLLEFLTFFAGFGPGTRAAAADFVQDLLTDPQVRVQPQSRDSFLSGLAFYANRLDKGYSGVDCISMQTMRQQGVVEVLTHDDHFAQEGFILLLAG